MPDFPLHNKDTAPKEALPTLEAVENAYGFIPNLLGVMASSPALAEAYAALADIFETKTALSAAQRQVVLLTASRFHECRYCMAAHSMTAAMAKVPDDVVDAIRQDRPIGDDKLEALRRLVDSIIERRGWPEEQVVNDFLAAGYQPQHILDVLVGIGQKTLSNYTNHMAGTPLDQTLKQHAWEPR